MATNNKPANTLRCGNIKARIWQNNGPMGPFSSATFSRPFKDQSGAWRMDYKHRQAYSLLGHLTPNEFAAQHQAIQAVEEIVCSH